MVSLSHPHDYVVLFLLAGLFGMLGGLGYELVQVRLGETGSLEKPRRLAAKPPSTARYWELGFIASMIVGGIAAVAISYFFTPEVMVKTTVSGVDVIQTKWQIVKVIPLSIIVGSGGGAFLDAMRGRVMGQLNAQTIAATKAAGETAVVQVAQAAKTATGTSLAAAGDQIKASAQAAIDLAAKQTPLHVADELLQLQVDDATRLKIGNLVGTGSLPTYEEQYGAVETAVASGVAHATEETESALDKHVQVALESIEAAATPDPG
ncbi:MAG TPA: hypothetical protein VMT59_02055 [Gaiellaceae bacterium]|nr:hypothetical protein [Gaiellaceae bacterium]